MLNLYSIIISKTTWRVYKQVYLPSVITWIVCRWNNQSLATYCDFAYIGYNYHSCWYRFDLFFSLSWDCYFVLCVPFNSEPFANFRLTDMNNATVIIPYCSFVLNNMHCQQNYWRHSRLNDILPSNVCIFVSMCVFMCVRAWMGGSALVCTISIRRWPVLVYIVHYDKR